MLFKHKKAKIIKLRWHQFALLGIIVLFTALIVSVVISSQMTQSQQDEVNMYNTKTQATLNEYNVNVSASTKVKQDLYSLLACNSASSSVTSVFDTNSANISSSSSPLGYNKDIDAVEKWFLSGYKDDVYVAKAKASSWDFASPIVVQDIIVTGIGADTNTEFIVLGGLNHKYIKCDVFWKHGKIENIGRYLITKESVK